MQFTPLTPGSIPNDVADHLHNVPCPDCAGEGSIEIMTGPGWYSMRDECWYPEDRIEPCPTCRATGFTGTPWEIEVAA